MSKRALAMGALVGSFLTPPLHAQAPPEVRLVFMDQGKVCRKLAIYPLSVTVDLDLNQAGYFYWQIEYYCAEARALYVDADWSGAYQPCTFCSLTIPALKADARVPNFVPSYATGDHSYRVRLCEPNSTTSCVEDDPEVEVRRPPQFLDDTVRVVLAERGGVCSATAPAEVRSTKAHAAVTWEIHNGCRETVRASVKRQLPSDKKADTYACGRDMDVPAGRTGRAACVLTSDPRTEEMVEFELVIDRLEFKTQERKRLATLPLKVKT